MALQRVVSPESIYFVALSEPVRNQNFHKAILQSKN